MNRLAKAGDHGCDDESQTFQPRVHWGSGGCASTPRAQQREVRPGLRAPRQAASHIHFGDFQ